jgi:type II secretory pathway component PulK
VLDLLEIALGEKFNDEEAAVALKSLVETEKGEEKKAPGVSLRVLDALIRAGIEDDQALDLAQEVQDLETEIAALKRGLIP